MLWFSAKKSTHFHQRNAETSTLLGVSFPETIPFELRAMARMMAAMFCMSRVPISSEALW
jgi:hypothetical protein